MWLAQNIDNRHQALVHLTLEPNLQDGGLDGLLKSIPEWHTLLDNLNGTIASRQQELAQLDDYKPPVRSLKNKGSTESLRPNDLSESPIHEEDATNIPLKVTSEPILTQGTDFPGGLALTTPISPAVAPPLLTHNSSPGPGALQRRTSNRIASALKLPPSSPPIARKRKTASVASNDSRVPKYRTRSMIIVYYDSAVQVAFEELVKFISASRNLMRKGKMAARMAQMRRMADMEMGSSDDEDAKGSSPPTLDRHLMSYNRADRSGNSTPVRKDLQATVDGDGDSDMDAAPKLQFISTRRMGPSRDQVATTQKQIPAPASGVSPLPLIPGMLRSTSNWRSSGPGQGSSSGPSSIYDELDGGLEWCQSMCERAAHQFLRDGDCNIEIEGIKRRLNEVKQALEKQKLADEASELAKAQSKTDGNGNSQLYPSEMPRGEMYDGTPRQQDKSRSLKAVHMRRTSVGLSTPPKPQVPVAMEVDEGYGDDDEEEEIPKLVWRSARDL